jgi:hypothetical protein
MAHPTDAELSRRSRFMGARYPEALEKRTGL